jgi:dipeptidyl aminopeptidase/acylaminoacyl peptidase
MCIRSVLLAIVSGVAAFAWSGEVGIARNLTLRDLVTLSATIPSDISVQLSPDSRSMAIGQGDEISLIDVRSPRGSEDLGSGFLPTWAPSGDRLAFYSNRSGEMQIWIWTRHTHQATQLTHFEGGMDPDPTTSVAGRVADALRLAWSPDGSKIAFASRVRAHSGGSGPVRTGRTSAPDEPMVLTSSSPPNEALKGIFVHASTISGVAETKDGKSITFRPGTSSNSVIYIADLSTGWSHRLTDERLTRFQPVWSPDGTQIAYVTSPGSGMKASAKSTQIAITTVRSGVERAISFGEGVKCQPQWSRDGSQIAFLQSSETYTPASIEITPVDHFAPSDAIPRFDLNVLSYRWSPNTGDLIVTYSDGPSIPLARTVIGSGSLTEISPHSERPVEVDAFSESDAGSIAWAQLDPARLFTIEYLERGAANSVTVRQWSSSDDLQLGTVKLFRWRNARGDDMESTILLPPNFRQDHAYPVIVDAYTHRTGANWINPMFSNYAWAGMGYVLFRPNPRAPHAWPYPWRSAAWSLAGKGPAGWSVTLDDVNSGVDELVRRGIADPNRMCLYGFSNGGGVVDELVTQTHRFRCAVSVAPALSDWVRPILLSSASSIEWWNGGVTIEDGIGDYIALSPVFHLTHVDTPMLIADGDLDGDFLLNSIEMYNGLRRLGKQVSLVRYPNAGHGFTGSAMRDFWQREMTFFQRYLTP